MLLHHLHFISLLIVVAADGRIGSNISSTTIKHLRNPLHRNQWHNMRHVRKQRKLVHRPPSRHRVLLRGHCASLAAKAVYEDALTAYDDWMAEDQRLCGLLFSSFSEEAMSEVIGCSTSNQIWETLSSVYQIRSRSSILQLRDQVLNLCRTSTVHDLHLKFKAIFDRLSSIGSAASNDDQVLWFLRALGSDFKEFSAPIMNQSPSPSYINVVAQDENHEAFLNSLSGHGSSGPLVPAPTAFVASDRSSFDEGNRWSSPGRGDGFSTGRTGDRSGRSSGRQEASGKLLCSARFEPELYFSTTGILTCTGGEDFNPRKRTAYRLALADRSCPWRTHRGL
ncbi:hypothetical protein QQ045_008005 [Rhodiola kirilowii]